MIVGSATLLFFSGCGKDTYSPNLVDRLAGAYQCTCENLYYNNFNGPPVNEVVMRDILVQTAGPSEDSIKVDGFVLPLSQREPVIVYEYPSSTYRFLTEATFFPEQDSLRFYIFRYGEYQKDCRGVRR